MTRIIFIVFTLLTIGVGYATVTGLDGESGKIERSVRAGSVGNVAAFGVK